MKKYMSQKDRVLALLKKKRWVKVQEMHAIAWRYGDILFRLRKEGHLMKKRVQADCRLEEWSLIKVKQ